METAVLLQTFKDLGFNSQEAKCYLALLERGTLTVGEVSKLAGIPRTNAYDSLEKLMSKGMCIERPGDTKRYSASDPALLRERFVMEKDKATDMELEKLRKKEKEILENAKAAKERVENVVNELSPRYEKGAVKTDPLDYIEIIRDPYQIHKRFMQLVAEAEQEILNFVKPPFSGPQDKIEEQAELGVDMSKRGIRVRSIYQMAKDEEGRRWQFEMIDRGIRAGGDVKVRVVKELPMKMAIFDSGIVIYALADPVSKQTSLTSQVVEHPDLARGLKILFDTLWERAGHYRILKD
jgi:sugar-specific transcriptional regulator TrmB